MVYDSGDAFVVYFDPSSGRTHLISQVAHWLLEELATAPRSAEQIKSLIVSQTESLSELEAEELIPKMIRELESLDLIEEI